MTKRLSKRQIARAFDVPEKLIGDPIPGHPATSKNPAAVALGKIRSAKKAAASRENGKKGGRPPSRKQDEPKRRTRKT